MMQHNIKKWIWAVMVITATSSLSACLKLPQASQPATQATATLPTATIQNHFALSSNGDDMVGHLSQVTVKRGDTLTSIAQRYDLGYQELRDANPQVNPNRLAAGSVIVLPTEYILPPKQYRNGIVINVPELRLYYFANNEVMTFPVALGREGWRTPTAKTYVYRKMAAPTWNVPASIRQAYFEKHGVEHPLQVGPGPENPLGNYAIYLQMPGYLIHGTNAPASIGHFVSSGCIRMYAPDIEALFNAVQKGTPVNIIYYPNNAGWRNGQLYLESYSQIQDENVLYPVHEVSVEDTINEAMGANPVAINWDRVREVENEHRGMPVMVQ